MRLSNDYHTGNITKRVANEFKNNNNHDNNKKKFNQKVKRKN
jgi:hypothetical protein